MGETVGLGPAPIKSGGAEHKRRQVTWSLALASCLFVIPLGASSAQTNELTAQVRTAPPVAPIPDDTASFAKQFAGVIPIIEPETTDIDLALPDSAVDLASFDPPREIKPKFNILRDLGTGIASYYGRRFHGRRTANGERFDMNAMTAAHKSLPFGTRVRVTNPRNGRAVTVRINDRGPFVRGRTIDLSRAAAERIGMIASGHARVKLDIVAPR
ncbi:MAG: septal ring lytic transglycosylase RlpA family protein [Pseudomonadota bacterium]